MSWLKRTLSSSIGGKGIVAVTGLALVGFLVAHISGNLLVFAGPEAINAYAEGLRKFPALLWAMRLGLIGAAVLHVLVAVKLNLASKAARPVAYAAKNYRKASFASRSMLLTGVLLLLFIVYHLAHYTFRVTNAQIGALGDFDAYQMLLIGFSDPVQVVLYLAAMAVMALHVSHGFQSLCQTIGLNHPKYTRGIRCLSCALGWGLAALYSSIPVAILLGLVK